VPSEHTLHPSGELDMLLAEDLRAQWLPAVEHHRPERLVIDLSDVTFMDSSGLGLIVAVHELQKQHGGVVVLSAPQRMVRRVLAISGIDRVIDVHGQ
jgi:anti-anti-sigma factor